MAPCKDTAVYLSHYPPREYVVKNLSQDPSRERFKGIIKGLGNNDREAFERDYKQVIEQHGEFIKRLSSKTIGEKDVKKAMALITNAQGNMWHYEQDENIAPTNNKLEGYFSELKQKYRAHKGLKKEHREAYLNWYIYYKNRAK